MRGMWFLCGLVLGAFLIVPAQAADEKGGFFNGKDLTGWEGKEGIWKVVDGAIVGTTDGKLKVNTFLCSKQKYGDFELSFKVRLKNGVGNSGVQIRSEVFEPKEFRVKGPQADIGAGFWGSLYGENFGGMMKQSPTDKVKKVVKNNDFNDYSIRCVGKKVTIKVNGETMVDGDFPKMPPTGIIALQAHVGPAMEVTFKDIKFSKLSGKN